jgi:spoIIIJ-associated protein
VVSTEDPIAREIETVVSTMLEQMEIRSRVKVEKSGDEYYANIRPLVSKGLLIGRKGTTLKSIQYLARLIIKRKYPDVPPVMVDVGGYRHRREEFLCKKAEAVATVVTQNGREMSLDLLTEKERAIVEEHLKQFPAVRVYAVPAGSKQNVIIAPK